MTEVTALTKHPCPACGGESLWNPQKQMLVCPFCGTSSPEYTRKAGSIGIEPDGSEGETHGGIKEYDLVAALRDIPDEKRGWQAERISVRCQHCEAVSVFEPGGA